MSFARFLLLRMRRWSSWMVGIGRCLHPHILVDMIVLSSLRVAVPALIALETRLFE